MLAENRIAALVHKLHSWGMAGLAASFIETAGPLAFLGAQALYFAGPALTSFAPEDDVTALAHLLEDPVALQALAHSLAEEP